MKEVTLNRRFGIAWVTFALAVAVHVTDEAMISCQLINPTGRGVPQRSC
jgi:hypothetical protein